MGTAAVVGGGVSGGGPSDEHPDAAQASNKAANAASVLRRRSTDANLEAGCFGGGVIAGWMIPPAPATHHLWKPSG